MSAGDDSPERLLSRYNEHQEVLFATLKQIEEVQKVDLSKYFKDVADQYSKIRLNVALKYNDKQLFMEEYKNKQKTIGLDSKDRLLYWQNKFSWVYKLKMLVSKVKNY